MRPIYSLVALLLLTAACAEPTGTSPVNTPARFKSYAERMADLAGRPALDYADPKLWGCSGASGDVCDAAYTMARVDTDGTETEFEFEPAANPRVDCFYVYPTVDLSMRTSNHDEMDDVALPRRTIGLQAAPFSEVCRVFAPFYRQARLGSYFDVADDSVPVYLNAFADVAAAFEYYLANWNEGRPVVLMGHSQGAQMTSYLLHGYFDGASTVTEIPGSETTDKLRERLVVGMPIGFHVFTPFGSLVGGSYSDLPLCESVDQTGCIITYRSYPENFRFFTKAAAGSQVDERMAELGLLNRPFASGDALSCVNPATGPQVAPEAATDAAGKPVDAGDIRLLLGSRTLELVLEDDPDERPDVLPGRYTAACRHNSLGGNFLAIGRHYPAGVTDVRGDPLSVTADLSRSALGLHLVDFHLPMGDFVRQVGRKIDGR